MTKTKMLLWIYLTTIIFIVIQDIRLSYLARKQAKFRLSSGIELSMIGNIVYCISIIFSIMFWPLCFGHYIYSIQGYF